MNNKKWMIWVVILFSTLSTAVSQEQDIVFEQITESTGRSLGFITGITQDENGFMWFATRKGLYRYNGYSYKLFKHQKNDSTSLPFNDIAYLYYDNDHQLWMRHFDQLSVFKDEKRVFGFDSITSKHYDIEVKIVQDKRGNYWVGPTGSGILKYNPQTQTTTNYHCPPRTYTPEAWQYFDSVLISTPGLVAINNPGNNADTAIQFNVQNDGYFIVASSGEIDSHGKYDFGSIFQNGNKVWELSSEKSKWAGGEEKNLFEVEPIYLKKGSYTLKYQSDITHSCEQWDGKAPDKIDFCGVKLVPISELEANNINKNLLNDFKDSTYIESENIKDIFVDKQGNFWFLSDKGLEKYDYKSKSFELFPINFEELLGTSIEKEYLRVFQDKEDVFWIASMYGLIQYDHMWSHFMVFQNTADKKVLTSNYIYSVFEDNQGRVWIGTQDGLNIYNKERNTIKRIIKDNHNRLYHNRIMQIFEDKGGNIWVATVEGLNRLIKSPFYYTDLDITADITYPVSYDQGANIWFALGNNISKYSRNLMSKFDYKLPDKLYSKDDFTGEPNYLMNDMVRNSDQNIWIATDNKISRYNIFDEKVDFVKEVGALIVGNDSLRNSVRKLVLGSGTKLFAFCPNGVWVINHKDLQTEAFYSFNQQYDFIEDVDLNFFHSAKLDKRGNIWIRAAKGIYRLNTSQCKLEFVYTFDDEYQGGPLSKGHIDFDKFGNVWFATLPQLHKINGESLEHQSWDCPYEHDWGMAHVKIGKQKVWIYGANGLYGFDQETEAFSYFSVENGFIDNNINGVAEDDLGNLWLTSLKGLIKLDIEEESAKNFFTTNDFTTHHFLGNPTEFSTNTNEFLFFTDHGFVSFYPDSINRNVPKLVVDRFTIHRKDYSLDSLIYYKKTIHLKYNQNEIGFEFAVLDYSDPAENHYKYKLEGVDDEWIETTADNRRANYNNIDPGTYTFKVIGSNNDKTWNEKGVSIDLIITPPWYETILAYILYVLFTATAIWLFIRIRERRLKEEKRILEQKVRERTAEIEAQKEELAAQNEKIAEQHKNITDSIQYAQRIQRAILPPVDQIAEVVDEFFVLYRPRDIVSGDYYWATRRDNITIIVAADCTGHGVPGAFMSMLGVAFLNEIVNKEGICQPNAILDRLREQIVKQLHQTGKEGESKDGMDLSLYVIDHKAMKLKFSGAYNPLYVIRNDEVIQLKADRMPIGYHMKMDSSFTMQEIELQKGDCLYNSSDGYPDQFGGKDGRKFMSKNFKELLLEVHHKPMAEQREILNTTFDKWRGDIEQIDDVIVIGVRI